MGILTASLFGFSIGSAILAYCLYEPYMPHGVTGFPPYLVAGIWKLSLTIGRIANIFGFEWNKAANFFLESVQQKNSSHNVTHTEEFFGGIPVRVYRPSADAKHGTRSQTGVVYFHGGGWCLGTAKLYGHVAETVADTLKAVVASVDYRLAPQHVFPTAFTDSVTATEHFIRHAQDYGVDSNKIVLLGDSAGGHMAAVVASALRDKKFIPMPKLQVLIYPVLQVLDLDTPSYRYNSNGPVLTRNDMAMFISNYLFGNSNYLTAIKGNGHTSLKFKKELREQHFHLHVLPDDDITETFQDLDPIPEYGDIWKNHSKKFTDLSLNPILASDLTGLPKTYISSCQYDVLRDDSFFYTHKLHTADVEVRHVNLDACFHGWLTVINLSQREAGYLADILTWVKNNL